MVLSERLADDLVVDMSGTISFVVSSTDSLVIKLLQNDDSSVFIANVGQNYICLSS